MKLHVVTAITRPSNLTLIAESLAVACARAQCDLVWHWRHDWDHAHIGGQKLKNDALDAIVDGWVWFLDDDTLADARIPGLIREHERVVDAIVVEQQRADGRILPVGPEHVAVGSIDIGQAIIRRSAIADARIPEHYDGDGMFLASVLPRIRVAYLPIVASYHNALAA